MRFIIHCARDLISVKVPYDWHNAMIISLCRELEGLCTFTLSKNWKNNVPILASPVKVRLITKEEYAVFCEKVERKRISTRKADE